MDITARERFIQRQVERGIPRETAERGANLILRRRANPEQIQDNAARDLARAMLAEVAQPVATTIGQQSGKTRARCPNPRDCGDPSCTGDCGY